MVITPGVYQLTDGSRIKDAIAAAGGAAAGADVTVLNLAAVVADGQKIVVPRPGQSVAALDGSGLGSTGPPAKVNLNTATVEQLDKLPSIGPVLAQRILAFRQQKGRFTAARQLQDVEGVGQKKYDQLKDLVTI